MKPQKIAYLKYLPLLLIIGLLAGFLNGLLGAGGGILIVMGLRLLFGKKTVNGRRFYTTAIAVMLPLSLVSVWQYAKRGHLPAITLGDMLLPALLGGLLGALLLRHMKPALLARIFAAVVLVSGIVLVI
ncbi:MAG: TSUP family transporter [Clostridia bacterium]|nr:TSUP family transporter [Clostridia bacterium]